MFVQQLNRFHKLASAVQNQSPIISLISLNKSTYRHVCDPVHYLSINANMYSNSAVRSNHPTQRDIKSKVTSLFGRRNLFDHNTNALTINNQHFTLHHYYEPQSKPTFRQFHTSKSYSDAMEFFDKEEYWGAAKVRVGRSWLKDELRIKSNEDLQKLWFVLIKERNMLLTMEEAYKVANEHMPNEERIDKVQESMENLEEVVRERNRAYFELETGGSGERERQIRQGPFGLPVGYATREHAIPWRLNSSYRKTLRFRFATNNSETVRKFVRRYLEKTVSHERWARMKQMRRCANLLKRFPDSDEEALQEKFPLVDIKMVKRWKRVRGHHHNYEYDVFVNPKNAYGNK